MNIIRIILALFGFLLAAQVLFDFINPDDPTLGAGSIFDANLLKITVALTAITVSFMLNRDRVKSPK
jgi:hypothetical protein